MNTSTRTNLHAALNARKDGETYEEILRRLKLQGVPEAQQQASEHALQAGHFTTVACFVRWFEKHWACTLHLTAALGHEYWMKIEDSRGRTPHDLARVALRQIKATLIKAGDSPRQRWQAWNAIPEMGYHGKVVRALLGRASAEKRVHIRRSLHPGISARNLLHIFRQVLGTTTVDLVLRAMQGDELQYRMAQRVAIQFLGLPKGFSPSPPRPARRQTPLKRKASTAGVCTTCGSPMRPRLPSPPVLAQE